MPDNVIRRNVVLGHQVLGQFYTCIDGCRFEIPCLAIWVPISTAFALLGAVPDTHLDGYTVRILGDTEECPTKVGLSSTTNRPAVSLLKLHVVLPDISGKSTVEVRRRIRSGQLVVMLNIGFRIPIRSDIVDIDEVNGKLVKLSTELKASLITQDFNTKKLAELENIKVLNLNDLSNALKPIFVSGEDVEIQIVKRGKEPRQGVGFLSDGTMVVIEDGGDHVGEVVKTKVNNILQTGAGRIVFCRIGEKKD